MGMAASQCRFLQLTQRNNDIGRQLTSLSMDKVRLSQDMNKVTANYQKAMNAKSLKWSNNNGKTYVDMSYSNLMTPNAYNNNTPYLVTDSRGRIVVDSKYKRYAEMISPDGRPNADWSDSRSAIIAELTGIDPDVIENLDGLKASIQDNKADVDRLMCDSRQNHNGNTTQYSPATLLGKVNSDWKTQYNKGESSSVKYTDESGFKNVVEQIKNNLSKFFAENKDLFEKACDIAKEESNIYSKSGGCTIKDIYQVIAAYYQQKGGNCTQSQDGQDICPLWYDVTTPAYQQWEREYNAWKQELEQAKEIYESSLEAKTMACTTSQESLIEFYDTIFSAIAENGWSYNSQVSDTNYLNQLLQNNVYTLTNIDRDYQKNNDGSYSYVNKYNTDIASNCKKVFKVNDSPDKDNALVNYEKEKSIINAKETRIDTRMKNLQTEQSAIQNMIKSIQSTINKNIEEHMNIFSA